MTQKYFIRLSLLAFCLGIICSLLPAYQTEHAEPWEKSANDRQPPAQVMDSIGVKSGMVIGEIGAGRGRYTVHLALRVGKSGKIFANDIRADSLAYLEERCRRNDISNVETVQGEVDDPRLPEKALDMAFMVWVYHHLEKPVELLKNLKSSLKPDATLVIIDPAVERGGEKDSDHPTTPEKVKKDAELSGYELIRVETFLLKDNIYILKIKDE